MRTAGAPKRPSVPASEKAGGLFDAVLPSSIGDSSALLSTLSIRNHNPWPSIFSFFFEPVRSDQIDLYPTSVTNAKPPFARETSSVSTFPPNPDALPVHDSNSAQPFYSKTRSDTTYSLLQTRPPTLLHIHPSLRIPTSTHCDDTGEVLSGEAARSKRWVRAYHGCPALYGRRRR